MASGVRHRSPDTGGTPCGYMLRVVPDGALETARRLRRRTNSLPDVKPEAGDHFSCRRRSVIVDGRVNGVVKSPNWGSMGHPSLATVRSHLRAFTKWAVYRASAHP